MGLDLLGDRELAVFSLIAAEQGVGHIAKELGISRKTVESHSEHIKLKLGYANAEELKRGARELISLSLTAESLIAIGDFEVQKSERRT